jgi:DNA-binding transcriptional LysR family regulator
MRAFADLVRCRVLRKQIIVVLVINMVNDELSLDLLRDLDVLLDVRHVTIAAKHRGITQSAMSARLSKLRQFFGDPLLVDARPRLLLTERAESLRLPLRTSLSNLDGIVSKPAEFDPKISDRTFTLVGGDAAEALAVPRLLESCRRLAPNIKLRSRRLTRDLHVELGDGGGDIGFEPMFRVPKSLQAMVIMQERFVVMMRADHPLAKTRLTLSKYLAYPHILIAPSGLPGSVVDDALEKMGKRRVVSAVIQHFTSAPIVVVRSDALLTCPSWLVHAVSDLMPVVSAPAPIPLPSYPLAAVWHERCNNDPAHRWLRAQLRLQTQSLL